MRKVITITLCASLALFTTGCFDGPPAPKGCIPGWYLSNPKSDVVIYAASMAESSDMEWAVQQAEADAVNKIAGRIKTHVKSFYNRVRQEVKRADDGILDNVDKVQELTVQQSLSMFDVPNKEICDMGNGKYQVFVQCAYDVSAAKAKALEVIKRDKKINDLVDASALYDKANEVWMKENQ